MNRRDAILALAALGAPLPLIAQAPTKLPRIGLLVGGTSETAGHLVQAFIKGMADLGYKDGKNVHYELRYGDSSREKAERNARELIAAQADVLWAPSTLAATAAQKATLSLPIVFAAVSDPVRSGIVKSLSRPATNASGISLMSSEMAAKRIEVLNEIFPQLKRLGVLHHPGDSASLSQLPYVQQGAKAFGKELKVVEARTPEEFEAAFAKLVAWRADALMFLESSFTFTHRKVLLELATKRRWPTVTSSREYAEAGAVVAYGADLEDAFRRSAAYVDKILKGAKPSDLPVEQPTKFEFVINLKAAKAMRLSIPQIVLLRADRVIE